IALTVDQCFAHGPWLRHMDKGRVNYRLTMRVIVTARVAANLGALPMLPIWKKRKIMHRVEDATLRGLESVTRIRQGPPHNDGHRIVEKRLRDFFGNIDRFSLFVRVIHFAVASLLVDQLRPLLREADRVMIGAIQRKSLFSFPRDRFAWV